MDCTGALRQKHPYKFSGSAGALRQKHPYKFSGSAGAFGAKPLYKFSGNYAGALHHHMDCTGAFGAKHPYKFSGSTGAFGAKPLYKFSGSAGAFGAKPLYKFSGSTGAFGAKHPYKFSGSAGAFGKAPASPHGLTHTNSAAVLVLLGKHLHYHEALGAGCTRQTNDGGYGCNCGELMHGRAEPGARHPLAMLKPLVGEWSRSFLGGGGDSVDVQVAAEAAHAASTKCTAEGGDVLSCLVHVLALVPVALVSAIFPVSLAGRIGAGREQRSIAESLFDTWRTAATGKLVSADAGGADTHQMGQLPLEFSTNMKAIAVACVLRFEGGSVASDSWPIARGRNSQLGSGLDSLARFDAELVRMHIHASLHGTVYSCRQLALGLYHCAPREPSTPPPRQARRCEVTQGRDQT
ncbi:hypothetical protein BKA67DRAFT_533698 [Truncatella angustata]|uniref:Uncharacterized protein n=1 Tax=Truncatella angustata TaxID=152316 RepID=A0A9P9A1P5_9PEZI|nr:uncharacterized protein BKA67DRAFT_533698 [Truncatella angustata]KAH6658548.1 hypothetical protein BKA67DRAFT_533698 [Truncatella angustata]